MCYMLDMLYIYIYIYIKVYIVPGLSRRSQANGRRHAVSSHNFNSLNFKCRVSDARSVACFHCEMPFESSDLPEAGPVFPD